MPLSTMELRELMPHGGVREVAREIAIAESSVSAVFRNKARPKTPEGEATVRRIQEALARKVHRPWHDVFPLTSTPVSARTEATPHRASASVRVPRARAVRSR